MRQNKIKVLKVEPMETPKICYIEPSMKYFEKAVNEGVVVKGAVEAKKLEKNLYAVFNKDRFLANLTPNRRIGDDIIAGVFFIVATDKNKLPISLTEEQVTKYAIRFWNFEVFDEMDVAEANINTLLSRLWKDEEL